MRSSIVVLVATTLAGVATATPLNRRYETCILPKEWHACGDGWSGCCTVTPCRGPAEGVPSGCPDDDVPDTVENPTLPTTPTYPPLTPSEPSAVPGIFEPDTEWTEYCKEDNSNCNWNATFYAIDTADETFSQNRTNKFYINKSEGKDAWRRDSIAVFHDIPEAVKKCTISWYKPPTGIFYGMQGDGSIQISTIKTGGKPFLDAVGCEQVNYKSTKDLIAGAEDQGVLDLGNWGNSIGAAQLNNGRVPFDCSGSEVVVHFKPIAQLEGTVIVDQVSELGKVPNNVVQRAGWYISYVL